MEKVFERMADRKLLRGFLLVIVCACSGVMALAAQRGGADDGAKVLNRSKGSITFVVDENLPAPKAKLNFDSSEKIAMWFMDEEQIGRDIQNVVKMSFEQERLDFMGKDNLYRCMVNAYADHRPLVLSPDMVWLIISQGFAGYVNKHAEQLRPLLVEHEGKMDIAVWSDKDVLSPDADWEQILEDFSEGIAKNTTGEIAKTMRADFTTTGMNELVASQITLMETVKSYFTYRVFAGACGIPTVTLQGTPGDWEKVLKKTRRLSQYGLETWVADLERILAEFVRASKGNPNQQFWQDMVKKVRVGELRGGACSPDKITKLDGWFLKFFPDKDGQTPDSVAWNTQMPTEMVRVGFKYMILEPDDSIRDVVQMELWAGFVGVAEDSITGALTPKIGWFVRVADEEKESLARLETQDRYGGGLYFTVRPGQPVPEILSKLPHVKRLHLGLEGTTDLPAWMESMQIEELILKGEFSEEEETKLLQRFPKAKLKNTKGEGK